MRKTRLGWGYACAALAIVAGAAGVVGCAQSGEPDEQVGSRQQAVSIPVTLSVKLPAGTGIGDFAVAASGSLRLGDRTKLVNSQQAPSSAANAGSQATELGVEAATGSVISVAPVTLRNRAKVTGDVKSAGTISPGVDVVVSGISSAHRTDLTPTQQESIVVDFGGTSLGDRIYEPPNTGERVSTLAPGRYGQVVLKSRNRLNLSAGTYVVDALQLEPQSRIVIDDSAGPVLLSVRDTLLFKGKIEALSGLHPAIRVAYAGSSAVVLETAFAGTLLAPNASLRLGTPTAPARFVGSFYAKDLEVSPDSVVELRPFFTYVATKAWGGLVTYGPFRDAQPLADGTVMGVTEKTLFRINATGTPTAVYTSPSATRFFVNTLGRFALYTDSGVSHHTAEGALLGGYALPQPALARFAPGTDQLVLLQASHVSHDSMLDSMRVVSGGSSGTVTTTSDIMLASAVTTNRVIYGTQQALVGRTFAGSESWRVSTPVRELVASENGNVLFGVRRVTGSKVIQINPTNGAVLFEHVLPAPIWQLDVSPSGAYALAATKNKIYVYQNAQLVRTLSPAIATFATADVNDRGEVLVGGKTAAGVAVVQLIGPAGTQGWSELRDVDPQAYRPFVRFSPSSADFAVIRFGTLDFYKVKRSL
jgi:hypothetical protein